MKKTPRSAYKVPLAEAQKLITEKSSYRRDGELKQSVQRKVDKLVAKTVRIASGYADPFTEAIKHLEF